MKIFSNASNENHHSSNLVVNSNGFNNEEKEKYEFLTKKKIKNEILNKENSDYNNSRMTKIREINSDYKKIDIIFNTNRNINPLSSFKEEKMEKNDKIEMIDLNKNINFEQNQNQNQISKF